MDAQARGMGRIEGVVAVLLTLVGWSSVPLFLKFFAAHIDAWTSNGWRYGFSALFWSPVVILGLMRGNLPPGVWRRALVPGAFNCFGQIFFTWAHYKIDPGLITFALRAHIVFVAVGALLLFPAERRVIRTAGFIGGNLLVVGGTMVTVLGGGGEYTSTDVVGIVMALLAGLFFAAYGLSVRWCMEGVRPLVAFSVISQYTALGMIVLMLFLGERAGLGALDLSGLNFFLLLLSAFIGIALGHVCYYTSIAKLGVAVSSGIIQLQPFLASIGSLWLFGERLTAVQWTGGCVAVFGAFILLRAEQRVRRESMLEHTRREEAPVVEVIPLDHVAAAALAREHESEEGEEVSR